MLGMLQADIQKRLDMVVVQRVVHHLAILALLHQPKVAQYPQVLRDSRIRDTHNAGDVADTELLPDEAVDNLRLVASTLSRSTAWISHLSDVNRLTLSI
jgi:hypothetical protein